MRGLIRIDVAGVVMSASGQTTKLSHPGPKDKNRDSGTENANPGWLQRFVRRVVAAECYHMLLANRRIDGKLPARCRRARAQSAASRDRRRETCVRNAQ